MAGDITLVEFDDIWDGYKARTMVDILENRLANYSKVSQFLNVGAYQLTSDTTQTANVGGGEDNLTSYTVPANTLQKDGYNLEIVAWGTIAANANNKTIKMYFGSSVIYDTGALAANNGAWQLRAIVTRTGALTQQSITTMISSNTTIAYGATFNVPTEDLSANIIVKCTGTGTANNDVVQRGLLVRVFQQG